MTHTPPAPAPVESDRLVPEGLGVPFWLLVSAGLWLDAVVICVGASAGGW